MIRFIFLFLSVLLPSKIKIILYSKFLGWEIDPTARIGKSLILCDEVKIGKGARVGNLTVIKRSVALRIGEQGGLGSLNWVTGFPTSSDKHFCEEAGRQVSLIIQDHAAITNRHLIDCTDSVSIGKYSTFAGFRSQILTHSIDLKESRQACKQVIIGDYCFVGTNCILLPGARIPNYSIVAAGSVVHKAMTEESCLYGGVPVKKIKKISTEEYKYMNRKVGFIN